MVATLQEAFGNLDGGFKNFDTSCACWYIDKDGNKPCRSSPDGKIECDCPDGQECKSGHTICTSVQLPTCTGRGGTQTKCRDEKGKQICNCLREGAADVCCPYGTKYPGECSYLPKSFGDVCNM